MRASAVLLASVVSVVAACSASEDDDADVTSADLKTPASLTPAQRLRADRLVSVFENGTIDLQYDYVEDIHDGRGYTAGRGFTTATGDVLRVTKDYLQAVPQDPLAAFVPELEHLARAESGDTSNLVGFPAAWKAAAARPEMRAAEDREVEHVSFKPALGHAHALGLRTPLAIAELYDAVVMNGNGRDDDGVPALIRAATAAAHGTPKTGVTEHAWLRAFLRVRRADLAHAHDPDTRKAWAEAVSRVDVFKDLLDKGNDALTGPIHVRHGYDVVVP